MTKHYEFYEYTFIPDKGIGETTYNNISCVGNIKQYSEGFYFNILLKNVSNNPIEQCTLQFNNIEEAMEARTRLITYWVKHLKK